MLALIYGTVTGAVALVFSAAIRLLSWLSLVGLFTVALLLGFAVANIRDTVKLVFLSIPVSTILVTIIVFNSENLRNIWPPPKVTPYLTPVDPAPYTAFVVMAFTVFPFLIVAIGSLIGSYLGEMGLLGEREIRKKDGEKRLSHFSRAASMVETTTAPGDEWKEIMMERKKKAEAWQKSQPKETKKE